MTASASPAVDAVLAVLRQRTGLDFPPSRVLVAQRGIARAMAAAGVGDPAEYCARLRRDPAALDALTAEVTVGETYFFREPEQWRFIRDRVLPELGRRPGPLRAWSAACSTGEEPYTLAILLRETGQAARWRVTGTDVSRPRLAAARAGRYSAWSMRGVPEASLRRCFREEHGRYELLPALRAGVEFRHLNLADSPLPPAFAAAGGLDLVICRNVLIYFDRDAVARVAARLLASLRPGGWLFLGASDPALAASPGLEVVVTAGGLAYRRRDEGAAPAAPAPRPLPLPLSAPAPAPAPGTATPAEAEPWLPRAERLYAEGDREAVVRLARAGLAANAGEERGWELLVRALADRGRLAEAETECAHALLAHRTSAGLAYLHALVLSGTGRPEDAAAAARRALYLDPALAVGHLLLGRVQARLGRTAAAARSLRNAADLLERCPADAAVALAGGEPAGRLLQAVHAQLRSLQPEAA